MGNQSGNSVNRGVGIRYRIAIAQYAESSGYFFHAICRLDRVRGLLVPHRVRPDARGKSTWVVGCLDGYSHSPKMGARSKGWGITWAVIFGIRAGVMIWGFGERLTPDTNLFAHGQASWSSIVGASSGKIAGLLGIQVVGLIGAILLGGLLGYILGKSWIPLVVFVSPPGLYTMQAANDAIGAFAAGIAGLYPATIFGAVPVAAFHLESGLVVGFDAVIRRMGFFWPIAPLVGGCIACIGEVHFQARYFLPGLVIMLVRLRQ